MKVASRILFLIGGIASFVNAGMLLIMTWIFGIFEFPFIRNLMIEAMESGEASTTADSPEMAARIVQISFAICIVLFIIYAALCLVNGILSLKARRNPTKQMCIINIVFGLISGVYINTVGGFLGFFSIRREENQDVIDMTKKE